MRPGDVTKNKLGYKMLIPATLMILVVNIYPFINGIYLSMTDLNLLKPESGNFVGFKNYIHIILNDSEFKSVLQYSFIYTFLSVLLSYLFGLVMALLLNKDIKFRGVFRALALIPWVIPPVVASTNWIWILNDQLGIVNHFLQNIGILSKPILFLADKDIARMTVILVGAWKTFPFMMIVLLAGLQSIDNQLYEAAYMDGSGTFRTFFHITLPMLRNVTLICTTLLFIWTFNTISFNNIYLLTKGGPSNATFVMSILSYYTAFFRSKMGYASAITVVMLVVMMIMSVIYLKLQRNND